MKAARKLILTGLLLMVLVICAACADNEEKYDEIISEGKSLFKKEDYEKAEKKFDEAIKLLPGEPDAYLELYELYMEQEEYDLAEEILGEGLDAVDTRSGRKKIENKQEELKPFIVSGKDPVVSVTPAPDITETEYHNNNDTTPTPSPTEIPATPTPEPDDEITLVMWDNVVDLNAYRPAFDKAIEKLKQQYPNVKIAEESYEYERYKMRIKASVAANEMPDIFMTYSGYFLGDFVQAGKVYCLDDILKGYINNGEINESMLENSRYDGKYYGAPLAYNFVGFYANMDLLEKAGWYEIPKTIDELTECCEALLTNGIIPFDIGGYEYWCISEWIEPIIEKCIGEDTMRSLYSLYGTWNDQRIADAINLFRSMVEKGYFDSDAENRYNDTAKNNFINGKCAFYQNGTWNIGDISKSQYNIKIGEFPVIDPKNAQLGELVGGPSEVLAVAGSSQYAEKAAEIAVELSKMISNYQYIDGAGLSSWKVYMDDSDVNALAKEALTLGHNAKNIMLFGDVIMTPEELENYISYMGGIYDGSVTGEDFITKMYNNIR